MNKQLRTFHGMNYVQQHYRDSKLSDTDFAVKMSKELEEPYSMAHVRQFRQSLGVPVNNAESPELLRAKEYLRLCVPHLPRDMMEQIRDFLGEE